ELFPITSAKLGLNHILGHEIFGLEAPFLELGVDPVATDGDFTFETRHRKLVQAGSIGDHESALSEMPVAEAREPERITIHHPGLFLSAVGVIREIAVTSQDQA